MPVALDNLLAVRRAALDALARREQGRAELTKKLLRRGAPLELIHTALDALEEHGLLSETRYLEVYIHSRVSAGYGPLRIATELKARGIDREAIGNALDEADVNWDEVLQRLFQRKFGGRRAVTPQEYAQQQRFLNYRGFSLEVIGRLLQRKNVE